MAGCSPLLYVGKEEDEEYDEFGRQLNNRGMSEDDLCQTAESHAQHIENLFKDFYDIEMNSSICQITDNTNVNLKVAEILDIFQIGCRNHLLAIDANLALASDGPNADWVEVYEEGETTMKQLRNRVANRVILRQTTDLVPVLPVKTRWSGRYMTLKRFNKLKDDVALAHNHRESNFDFNNDPVFHAKCVNLEKRMAFMQVTTKLLQRNLLPYYKGRNILK